jgi:hypothetical protein
VASPFGEPERLGGRWLPFLRLTAAVALTALAAGALMAAAGTGPAGYLITGVYALYTQWHGPALNTPWLWPARPGHDLGGALCAALVFIAGLTVITVRGARDRPGETD